MTPFVRHAIKHLQSSDASKKEKAWNKMESTLHRICVYSNKKGLQ